MTEHEQDSKFTKNKRQDGENKMDIQEWIIFAIELIGTERAPLYPFANFKVLLCLFLAFNPPLILAMSYSSSFTN